MPEIMTRPVRETEAGAISDEALGDVLELASRSTIVALGPGLTSSDQRTEKFVRQLVEQRSTPMVIDADGLNCLAPWPAELRGSPQLPLMLTPHPGEMLRLLGTADKAALADRVATVADFAARHQVIVLLKGSRGLISSPEGRVMINPTGNAGLGTAGSGDTLTGLLAGFNAQAFGKLKDAADPLSATIAALYVGGLAGDLAAERIGMRAMVASDIRDHFAAAICSLDAAGEKP